MAYTFDGVPGQDVNTFIPEAGAQQPWRVHAELPTFVRDNPRLEQAVCQISTSAFQTDLQTYEQTSSAWTGSGVLMSSDWVLTNSHVAGDTESVTNARFTWQCGSIQRAARLGFIKHLTWDQQRPDGASFDVADLALLNVRARPLMAEGLLCGRPSEEVFATVKKDDIIYCYHYGEQVKRQDGSIPLQVTRCTVTRDRIQAGDGSTTAIKSTPSRHPGSSGAPMFDKEAKLVGINFAGSRLHGFHVSTDAVSDYVYNVARLAMAELGSMQQLLRRGERAEAYRMAPSAVPEGILVVCPDFDVRKLLRATGQLL